MVMFEKSEPAESLNEAVSRMVGDVVDVNEHETHTWNGGDQANHEKNIPRDKPSRDKEENHPKEHVVSKLLDCDPISGRIVVTNGVRIMCRVILDRARVREPVWSILLPVMGNVMKRIGDVQQSISPGGMHRIPMYSPFSKRGEQARGQKAEENRQTAAQNG
jgi:hypothetical protein